MSDRTFKLCNKIHFRLELYIFVMLFEMKWMMVELVLGTGTVFLLLFKENTP